MVALCLSGCASNPSVPYDRFEPYNRVMYQINDTADRYVLKPVAQGYKAITPSPVQTGISNFFDNFKDVYSMASNALRAEPEKALNDLMRVVMNTGFGLFGFIDIASQAGLKNNKNTLGDTFATWGWHDSNYFVMPLFGPSTVRDGSGQVVTMVAPRPEEILYSNRNEAIAVYGLSAIEFRARYLDVGNMVDTAAVDPYAYTRDAFMQLRAKRLGLPDPTGLGANDINLDELINSPAEPASKTTLPGKPVASAAQ
ncbi:VacJ family lipoprotein [Neisseriaceae bacterium TC5R-5]|nr:VacJ family lipoprotein [Neisseriaceae bacterium TC5R-5]